MLQKIINQTIGKKQGAEMGRVPRTHQHSQRDTQQNRKDDIAKKG